jgi:HlyD family secretion protein
MKRFNLIILIAGCLAMVSCSNDKDQPDAYGTFEADEITVSSLANGRLLRFAVEEGMMLDSGQVVGFVDTTDLYLKKMQAIDQRSATSSKLGDLSAQVAVQEQNRENLLVEQRRVANMLKDGAATQKQMDDINSGLKVIDAQIAAIRTQAAGVNASVNGISQQIAQLEESIRNSYIVNPVKGTVLTKFAERDEVTSFGKPLYKIADITTMTLRVYISGTQLPHIKLGQKVQVRFDRDEKTNSTLEGTVSWISQSAEFTPKTIQTKEERVNLVYAVKVKAANDGSLKIGMPGEIKLTNP